VDPNFANLTDMTPLNPPFERGKFSPPPLEGELEGVNLDLLILHYDLSVKLGAQSGEDLSGKIQYLSSRLLNAKPDPKGFRNQDDSVIHLIRPNRSSKALTPAVATLRAPPLPNFGRGGRGVRAYYGITESPQTFRVFILCSTTTYRQVR
jgi:hypothetical protein